MFRTSILAALLLTSIASTAFAGLPGSPVLGGGKNGGGIVPTGVPGFNPIKVEAPLVTLSTDSGFTMIDFVRNKTCEVYADRVIITKSFGGDLLLTETRLISLDGDIAGVIAKAAAEEVQVEDNFLCDAPGSFIRAGQDVVLFSSGGCGAPKQQRTGSAAWILRDLAAEFCGQAPQF